MRTERICRSWSIRRASDWRGSCCGILDFQCWRLRPRYTIRTRTSFHERSATGLGRVPGSGAIARVARLVLVDDTRERRSSVPCRYERVSPGEDTCPASHGNHTQNHRRWQVIDPAGGAGRLTWVRFPSPASPFHIQPSAARYPLPIRLADSNRADHECDAQLARSRARGMGRAADGGVTVAARQDARSVPRSTISRLAPCLRRGHHHFGEPASDYGLAGRTR